MITVSPHQRLNPETCPMIIAAIKKSAAGEATTIYKATPYKIDAYQVWICCGGGEGLAEFAATKDPASREDCRGSLLKEEDFQNPNSIWIGANPYEIVEKFTNQDGEEWSGPFEGCNRNDGSLEIEQAVNRRKEDLINQGCTDIVICPKDH